MKTLKLFITMRFHVDWQIFIRTVRTSQDTLKTGGVKTETETNHADIMTRLKPRPK